VSAHTLVSVDLGTTIRVRNDEVHGPVLDIAGDGYVSLAFSSNHVIDELREALDDLQEGYMGGGE